MPVHALPAPVRVHMLSPLTFNDAQEIGDHVKAGSPVFLDLRSVDRELEELCVADTVLKAGLLPLMDPVEAPVPRHLLHSPPRQQALGCRVHVDHLPRLAEEARDIGCLLSRGGKPGRPFRKVERHSPLLLASSRKNSTQKPREILDVA